MQWNLRKGVIAAFAVLALAAGAIAVRLAPSPPTALASEAPEDDAGLKAPLAGPHLVSLAAELAALGREKKDALLLVAAARLLAESNARRLTGDPDVSGGDAGLASPSVENESRSPSALLAEAKLYAAGNQPLLAVLDQRRYEDTGVPQPTKGTAAGHHEFAKWLRPGARATYRADFRAREPAEVAIWGDGSGDLDLVIYDASQSPVCVSRNPADREWCRWIPRRNETFTLVVESRSPRWNFYSIFTN